VSESNVAASITPGIQRHSEILGSPFATWLPPGRQNNVPSMIINQGPPQDGSRNRNRVQMIRGPVNARFRYEDNTKLATA